MSLHKKSELPLAIGPWTKLTSELRYENPWIAIYHENVISPGKQQGIYGRVHFKGQAVGILPLDEQGYTYLVRQYRYTLEQNSWEIPMGGCGRNESTELTAHRELQEETGLQAQQLIKLGEYHTSNSITDEKGTAYLAMNLTAGEQNLEHSESDLIVKKILFSEALKWVDKGKITDSISVAAILQADRWLNQQ